MITQMKFEKMDKMVAYFLFNGRNEGTIWPLKIGMILRVLVEFVASRVFINRKIILAKLTRYLPDLAFNVYTGLKLGEARSKS
ncbi:hypothetical protein BpHYR1_021728 [Brachionus plicatilis]|uniref:Uncharacterized protein n=1 Tax=Brachionus plicatilis TaxID=10195 RepID=A0A3M7PXT2_BRAPC|nr:hypothetical protein BpHYR1_021728 [Brachionus plicatilis]